MTQFAADNVDHNIIAIDGNVTFHGMGMIAMLTPARTTSSHTMPRKKVSDIQVKNNTQIDITEYHFAQHTSRNLKFKALHFL